MRKLLFSVTKKDFDIKCFTSGGKGVRITHRESGAAGVSRNFKSQHQNKKAAFERLTKSKKFKLWINQKVFDLTKRDRVEDYIENTMSENNLRVEIKSNKKWVETKELNYESNNHHTRT